MYLATRSRTRYVNDEIRTLMAASDTITGSPMAGAASWAHIEMALTQAREHISWSQCRSSAETRLPYPVCVSFISRAVLSLSLCAPLARETGMKTLMISGATDNRGVHAGSGQVGYLRQADAAELLHRAAQISREQADHRPTCKCRDKHFIFCGYVRGQPQKFTACPQPNGTCVVFCLNKKYCAGSSRIEVKITATVCVGLRQHQYVRLVRHLS
jgi:hypothetical protein